MSYLLIIFIVFTIIYFLIWRILFKKKGSNLGMVALMIVGYVGLAFIPFKILVS